MIDHNIDIICIQEHRYTHSEDIKYHDTGNGWTTSHCICMGKLCQGMLIGPRVLKSLNSMGKIQPRMMVATFNGNPSATVMSCYSPTNVSEETDLITFYNELSSLVCSIPKHNVFIIGGDMNAPKYKSQIQLTQLVKQKWGTSNRFHARK